MKISSNMGNPTCIERVFDCAVAGNWLNLATVAGVIGSIDIVMGEVDR